MEDHSKRSEVDNFNLHRKRSSLINRMKIRHQFADLPIFNKMIT